MAPHIEARSQAVVGDKNIEMTFGTEWVVVPGTMHVTGDISSDEAIKAHKLLEESSVNYREVHDFKGKACHGPEKAKTNLFSGIHIFQKKKE